VRVLRVNGLKLEVEPVAAAASLAK
jgi:hypothetical protein